MHRIDTKNYAVDTEGRKLFRDGNPHKPETEEATHLSAAWFNDVQEELCKYIEAQGISLEKGTTSQLGEAINRNISWHFELLEKSLFARLDAHRERINAVITHLHAIGGEGDIPEKL